MLAGWSNVGGSQAAAEKGVLMVSIKATDFQNRFQERVRSVEKEHVAVQSGGETKLIALSPAEYRRLMALAGLRSGGEALEPISADAEADIAATVDEVRADLAGKRRAARGH